ncbi:hypothetical protein TNCT_274761 [Trichonephila clavata]|uniref:Uncharacterized protein n=1 Tax=Trichonephila clavata TaxID=2740835 RepID=A0A8X6GAG0_TRICU|nr:hypothetical protein TNCT_274761 [Trichonephila clavata]
MQYEENVQPNGREYGHFNTAPIILTHINFCADMPRKRAFNFSSLSPTVLTTRIIFQLCPGQKRLLKCNTMESIKFKEIAELDMFYNRTHNFASSQSRSSK